MSASKIARRWHETLRSESAAACVEQIRVELLAATEQQLDELLAAVRLLHSGVFDDPEDTQAFAEALAEPRISETPESLEDPALLTRRRKKRELELELEQRSAEFGSMGAKQRERLENLEAQTLRLERERDALRHELERLGGCDDV